MTARLRYAMRADHERREYQVYDLTTDETVATFTYTNELSRGTAHGRANIKRRALNDEHQRKES